MLTAIMFAILGILTSPGKVYWVVFGIYCFIQFAKALLDAYNSGKDDK